MRSLLCVLLVSLVALAAAKDTSTDIAYTVTDEVWFDIVIKDMNGPGKDFTGRFTIAVFGDAVPLTALNFVSIARGYKTKKRLFSYKNSRIHRVVQDFILQMGDITKNDGSGGTSIYGDMFNDENFVLSHRSPGWVAMANRGANTNGSQFYIMMTKARWLDGKHVVFGKVIQGYHTIETVGAVPSNTRTGTPRKLIYITDCGVNEIKGKYQLTEAQLDSVEDL